MAYPAIGGIVEERLWPNEAMFLWMAIRGNWIPTQPQIDECSACNGLGLTPLSYLCGDILSTWATATGKSIPDALTYISNNPESTPWNFFLSASIPRSSILDDINSLETLTGQGFWGVALLIGQYGSPQSMYNLINSKDPPPQACSTTSQVVGVASSGATFSMAGAAFGPPGAIIGGIAGLVIGGLQQNDQCDSSSSCNIM